MNKLFADMEKTLAVDEWLAGDRFTLADIGMTPFVQRMEHLNLTMLFDDRRNLNRWFAAIKVRPSFKTAMADWFNPDYLALSERTGVEARPAIAAMLAVA